jgi:pyruvate kinase
VRLLATTTSVEVSRRLCLLWGAHSALSEHVQSYEDMVSRATELAKREGFASTGDTLVVVAGIPLGQGGTTNNLRVVSVS